MTLSTKFTRHKRDTKRVAGNEIVSRVLAAVKSSVSSLIRTNKVTQLGDKVDGRVAAKAAKKRVAKDRRALSRLSDRDLRDIGFTREQHEDIPSALSKRYTEIGFMRQGLRDPLHTRIRRFPKDE